MFRPSQPQSGEAYPLVIVYHGSAGIGTDNESQLRLFHKLFARPEIQTAYPAYLLAPQFSTRTSDYSIDTISNLLSSTSRPCLNSVFELVDSLKLNMNIDSNRIYVVGYSMGGSTVINSLSKRPDLFTAGISISGIPQFDSMQELAKIPIWLIHGTSDTVNPIESDEQLYEEINDNIRFWKLKGKTHDNIVTQYILGDSLPKWLFNHRKN
jgi:predicted peptidase